MLTRPRGEIIEAVVTWIVLLSIAAARDRQRARHRAARPLLPADPDRGVHARLGVRLPPAQRADRDARRRTGSRPRATGSAWSACSPRCCSTRTTTSSITCTRWCRSTATSPSGAAPRTSTSSTTRRSATCADGRSRSTSTGAYGSCRSTTDGVRRACPARPRAAAASRARRPRCAPAPPSSAASICARL